MNLKHFSSDFSKKSGQLNFTSSGVKEKMNLQRNIKAKTIGVLVTRNNLRVKNLKAVC